MRGKCSENPRRFALFCLDSRGLVVCSQPFAVSKAFRDHGYKFIILVRIRYIVTHVTHWFYVPDLTSAPNSIGQNSRYVSVYTLGSKNALGFSAYTGPKIVIGLRPWYKFDKRSDTGSNIENIIPVILESPSPI